MSKGMEFTENYLKKGSYYYTETLTGAGNGETINIPPGATVIGAELVPTAGTGKVQSSLDGTTWEDWTAGVVAEATREDVSPIVRYIRQVNATGTTKLNLGVV